MLLDGASARFRFVPFFGMAAFLLSPAFGKREGDAK